MLLDTHAQENRELDGEADAEFPGSKTQQSSPT